MTEQPQATSQEDEWVRDNACITYTRAFQIRQRLYRFNDWDLPFRHGVATEQFLTFFIVLVLTILLYTLLLNPLVMLISGQGIAWRFTVIIVLAPPILAAQRILSTMPNEKSNSGYIISLLNYHLDDEWHRRGRPLDPKEAPSKLVFGNYMRVWTVDPHFAQIESPDDLPASKFPNPVYRPYPDEPVTAIDETPKQSKTLLESDDEFYQRLRGTLDGDLVVETGEKQGIKYRAVQKTSKQFDHLRGRPNA